MGSRKFIKKNKKKFGSIKKRFIFVSNKTTKYKIMKATINFNTNKQAQDFALSYSRATLGGTTIADTKVSVYNVDADAKAFIDGYINRLNN
jgi:hypothetical protein